MGNVSPERSEPRKRWLQGWERLWGNGEEGDYNATETGLMLKEFC